MTVISLKRQFSHAVDDTPEDIVLDINVEDLSFGYGKDDKATPVLKDLKLRINGPQLISILGPNGVGKSTLIHCMNKILSPTSGKVFIGERDLSEISIKDLSKHMGYVPYASSDSFPLSVTDTILMGRHPHSKWGKLDDDLRVVHMTLQMIGIEELADRSFNELSAGQHQKVMLARGLAQEPKILLLDEPTSNLDIRYQLEITRLLRDLSHSQKMIVLMISHDINIASKYSDNIIMLHGGNIYATGTPNEVITKENIEHVYEVGCNVIEDDGRPHVILKDNVTAEPFDEPHSVVSVS